MELVHLLRRLSEASGVSGYEHEVRTLIRQEFARSADSVRVDPLGNVIALKRGVGSEPRPAVMLASHMDEIGLIVSELEQGFIRFQKVGGCDDRILPGQEVLVHGKEKLSGVIGARPPHILAKGEADKPVPLDELLIDVGLSADELPTLVHVGDLITMKRDMIELKNGLVAGKALDDRVSVAALVLCLDELTRLRPLWDVFAVATVQEEVGLKGAITSAYGLQPDLGIAIDVTWAQQPGATEEFTFELGQGPTIGCGPGFHPKLQEALVRTAKSLEMPYHLEPAARSAGADSDAMLISREGIPTELISIPLRNMHTPVETVSVRDVERAGRLLAAFVARLDDAFLPGLAWDLGLDPHE